jgi:CheY-like chemotaxis protein
MMNFLLIDDDDIFCFLHQVVINQVIPDAEIKIIESSPEAIKYLSDLKPLGLKAPDVIFLDINMPEMTGFELLEHLSEETMNYLKGSRIFILSSSIDARDMFLAKENPRIESFVGKPLTHDFLKKIL